MSPGLRVDFGQIIADLRAAGMHPSDIGAAVGVSGTMIRNYQESQQPRHSVGEALIELWSARLAKTRAELPMTSGLPVEP